MCYVGCAPRTNDGCSPNLIVIANSSNTPFISQLSVLGFTQSYLKLLVFLIHDIPKNGNGYRLPPLTGFKSQSAVSPTIIFPGIGGTVTSEVVYSNCLICFGVEGDDKLRLFPAVVAFGDCGISNRELGQGFIVIADDADAASDPHA